MIIEKLNSIVTAGLEIAASRQKWGINLIRVAIMRRKELCPL